MYYDDEEDKKDINKLDTYGEEYESGDEESEEDSQEESGEDSSGGIGMPGKGGSGLGKFASKTFKGLGKAVQKIGKVIAMLPLPVKIAIIVALTGIITYLIMEVMTTEASASVTKSVTTTTTKYQEKINNSTSSGSNDGSGSTTGGTTSGGDTDTTEEPLTQEQIEKIQKGIDFFEENNSYLYFTIDMINEAYADFVVMYEGATGDVNRRVYNSLSTEFGTETIESETSRLVNVNQKQTLYKHLLMTEKYDFNKIEWKRYGHGYNGEDSPMTEDKELGLKYPSDGVNKIDTFISLASPYMLTWHIPLGFHSGFTTKSGSSESASKFTYSIIKEASSKIIAHRYDMQKYILNTKFNDYVETEYKTKFKTNVDIEYKYTAQTEGENNPVVDESSLEIISDWENVGIIYVDNHQFHSDPLLQYYPGYRVETYNEQVVNNEVNQHYSQSSGGTFNSEIVLVYPGENMITAVANKLKSVGYLNPGINEGIQVIQYNLLHSSGSQIKVLRYRKFTCTVNNEVSSNFVRDTQTGRVIYDKTVSYKFTSTQILEPSILSTKDVNERLNENGEVDPMLEEQVGNPVITVDNRYYISKAKTFDVEIANTFNYVKYSETNAANRVKPKSEKETKVEDYYKIENEENDLDLQEIQDGYLYQSLTYLEGVFDIESQTLLSSSNPNNDEFYEAVKDNLPDEEVYLEEAQFNSTDPIITEKYTYQITYVNKNSYTVKEGKAEEGKGTHYIERQWEDRLTQLSSVTTAYDEEDLIDFNAEYNAELNGTTVEEEKETFEEIADRAEKNYSEYKGLAVQKLLNTIEFVNSNKNMFDEYMDDTSPQSKIRGYSRAYIEFCMEEVKRLFEETEDKNGTIPYVYGVSLGFTNVLENSNLNRVSNSYAMFLWPIETHETVDYIYGYSTAYGDDHSGIDLSVGGAEVLAAADGTIIVVQDLYEDGTGTGWGNYIKIDHGNGYATLYAHMLPGLNYQVGDTVKKGDVIGITGNTGNSTGSHLHFEIYEDQDGNGVYQYPDERIDPLQFYLVEPIAEKFDGEPIEYDELLINYELRYQINKQGMYRFIGYPYNADGMDLSKSELTKDEFVSLAEKNLSSAYGLSSTSEFYKELGNMYDYCQEVGVNPEYAVMTAVLENADLNGYGVHNYWNVGVSNEKDPTSATFADFEEALAVFCDLILSYRDPSSSAYASIMARFEEREAAGCNPEGYGTPDTLAGIQSIYSWIGDDHTGDNAGTGGMYYINIPGVIYETQAEIEEKCWSKHGTEGGRTSTEPTTIEEQNNYTAYGVREKLAIRNTIFEY